MYIYKWWFFIGANSTSVAPCQIYSSCCLAMSKSCVCTYINADFSSVQIISSSNMLTWYYCRCMVETLRHLIWEEPWDWEEGWQEDGRRPRWTAKDQPMDSQEADTAAPVSMCVGAWPCLCVCGVKRAHTYTEEGALTQHKHLSLIFWGLLCLQIINKWA